MIVELFNAYLVVDYGYTSFRNRFQFMLGSHAQKYIVNVLNDVCNILSHAMSLQLRLVSQERLPFLVVHSQQAVMSVSLSTPTLTNPLSGVTPSPWLLCKWVNSLITMVF